MAIFSISYDLHRPGQDYTTLHEAIKRLGPWAKPLESQWLVQSSLSANKICNHLRQYMDANDSVLVIAIGRDYAGFLNKEIWTWLQGRIAVSV